MLDKGKAAAVTSLVETKDKASGKVIFENQSTVFIRGSGGFGGKRTAKGMSTTVVSHWNRMIYSFYLDRGPASAANAVPKRAPDAIVEEKTTSTQAALYRLSGDYNPLHVCLYASKLDSFKCLTCC